MEFTIDEIKVLDKLFEESKWDDDGQFIFYGKSEDDRHAYYGCYDEDYVSDYDYEEMRDSSDNVFYLVPLEDYLSVIDYALVDIEEKLEKEEYEIYQNMINRCIS